MDALMPESDDSFVAQDITHAYGSVFALRDITFTVTPGVVHALLGENGCGKSTLVKIMTGAQKPSRGSLRLGENTLKLSSPLDAQQQGISVVHQNYHVFPDLSVSDNVIVGSVKTPKMRWLPFSSDHRLQRRQVQALLQDLGIELDARRLASTLDPVERKFVEIARAMAFHPRFIFLDEPTASLEPSAARSVLALIGRLRAQKVGVVFVSHRLDEVVEIADQYTVLRDSRLIGHGLVRDVTESEIVHMMVGELGERDLPRSSGASTTVKVRLSAVRTGAGARPFDLDVMAGEILSLTGLVGSGASEVVQMVGGSTPLMGGMEVSGVPRRISTPRDANAAGIGFIPEDRKGSGLIVDHSVAINISYGSLRKVSRAGIMAFGRVRAVATEYRERLGIRLSSVQAPVATLSGGNQQKVLIAKWLASGAQILAIEEPTQGVDVGGRLQIHRLLREYVLNGGTVIVASTDVREVAAISDRIAVFRHGELLEVLDASEIREGLEGEGSENESLRHYVLGVMESGVRQSASH